MKSYLISLILTVGIAALVSLLTPEGNTKKYVHFLLSLAVVAILVSPLNPDTLWDSSSHWGASDQEVGEGMGEDACLTATAMALQSHLAEVFSLPAEEIGVTVGGKVTEAGEVTVSRVTVTLSGESAARRLGVLSYLQEELEECEVSVYVG